MPFGIRLISTNYRGMCLKKKHFILLFKNSSRVYNNLLSPNLNAKL